MSELSDIDGRYWFPLGTRHQYGRLEPGQLIAFDHEAWFVVEVREHETDRERPVRVRLRPARLASHPDSVRAARADRHIGAPRGYDWHVFPDPEHYPVCACCGEPMPCRAETGRKYAEREIAEMGRYETAGVCPSCTEPVTQRQKAITFDDNVIVFGGPPPTFHLRGKCWQSAYDYEKRWAAAQPGRQCRLSCAGHLTNHADRTYECSEADTCPGPGAYHAAMSVCACPPCHASLAGRRHDCRPHPDARLRGSSAVEPSLFEPPTA